MDSRKVFGKELDFQEIIRRVHRGDSQ